MNTQLDPQMRSDRSSDSRAFHVEPLEARTVLSANPIAAGGAAPVEAQDPVVIQAIHLQVGDREVTVTERNEIVVYKPGEKIAVVGIDYEVSGEGVDIEGEVAFEGYLREPNGDSTSLGTFDYDDGRFTDPTGGLGEGLHNHDGLEGDWEVVDGTNRMSVALVRYFGDLEWEAHDRFFVNLQQGEADVALGSVVYRWYGDNLKFGAYVKNGSESTISTYTEIDVYHEDDLANPVWVGIFESTLGSGRSEFQRFYNPAADSNFDEFWQPKESGKYVIKVYLDPEDALAETDEDNNFAEGVIKIRV